MGSHLRDGLHQSQNMDSAPLTIQEASLLLCTLVSTLEVGEVGNFGDLGETGSWTDFLETGAGGAAFGCFSCASNLLEALASCLWVTDPPLTSARLGTHRSCSQICIHLGLVNGNICHICLVSFEIYESFPSPTDWQCRYYANKDKRGKVLQGPCKGQKGR